MNSICEHCGAAFITRAAMRVHCKAVHQNAFPYKCCGKGFTDKTQLRRHRCNHHGEEKERECDQCGNTFSTGHDLNKHLKQATQSGGRVMTLGVGTSDVALPLTDATMREVDVLGSIIYTNCFPTAIELVASGQVNVKSLITHRYKLEDAKTALQTAKAREGVKVMINCAT